MDSSSLLGATAVEFAVRGAILVGSAGIGAVLSAIFLGRRGRSSIRKLKKDNRKLNDRIAALEERSSQSSETPLEREKANDALSDEAIWLRSPGAGRIAARLIVTAPSLEEARRVYDGFRAAPSREHEESANYAFLCRLNLEGHGAEVYALAGELTSKHEDINMDPEIEQEFTRLYEDAKKVRGE